MGKKRKAAKVQKQKKVFRIPKFFQCPECFGRESVEIKIDKYSTAIIRCKNCGLRNTLKSVNPKFQPVDVYQKWKEDRLRSNRDYSDVEGNSYSDDSNTELSYSD